MTDIRPIREAEAEPFLQLLCDVFGLDYNRAYDVFFTEPLFDLQRKWALIEGRDLISILTTTPLRFGWGRTIGIAGVATRPDRRGEGHAGQLLQRVMKESEKRGEKGALLFARELGVYEKNGFEILDRVVRAEVIVRPEPERFEPLEFDELRLKYRQWSDQHEDRLRRDDRRWDYWQWHRRVGTPFEDGYMVGEGGTLRECMYSRKQAALPVPEGTEWFGTTFMIDQLEVPIRNGRVELYLMGHSIPGIPQMFMTDQF